MTRKMKLKRLENAQIVLLSDLNALLAEDVIGGHEVEVKVRDGEIENIVFRPHVV